MPAPSTHHDSTRTSLYAVEGLTRFVAGVLGAIGTSAPDAQWMAELIVGAEVSGHECHGLRRLPEYVDRWRSGKADPAATARIDLDRGALVRMDGGHGFGHVTMRVATDLAVDRARAHGIAGVAVHRTDHAGRFADYCQRAAAAGVATLIFANDAGGGQSVAPPGATEARLSTNPIAAGVPRSTGPHLVLDMATSVVAAGRLSESTDRGEQIPAEWVTSTGVLKPVGGAKGFGMALIAEALAGSLTEAGTVRHDPADDDQGVFMVAIDVERLRPLQDFTSDVEAFIGYVRDVPLEPGAPGVHMPGEGDGDRTRRLAAGIPVREFTAQRLRELADEFAVPLPVPEPHPKREVTPER